MAFHLLDAIDTKACRWLARGQLRDIYQHPDMDDALIKVIRPDRVDARGHVIGWSRRKFFTERRFGIYLTFQREFREAFKAARRFYGRPDFALPFARPLGVALTERGLGLIVEKLTAPDGALAPSVKQLLKEGGFLPRHRAALDRFFQIAADHHVVFGDLNAGNLVFVEDDAGGRFLAIDGIGEKTLIPIHELSHFLNARKLRRMQRRLDAYVDRRVAETAMKAEALPEPNGENLSRMA